MRVMHTSIYHRPIYFNVYPHLIISMTDSNILEAASLSLKIFEYIFFPGPETTVIYRIYFMVFNTLALKATHLTKPGIRLPW